MTELDFDSSVLEQLVDLGDAADREFLVELVDIFLRDAPTRVQAVIDCANKGDLEGVEHAAHALKGSAGNLGAVLMRNLAETLQNASRTHDKATVSAHAPKLGPAYEAVESELRKYLASIA